MKEKTMTIEDEKQDIYEAVMTALGREQDAVKARLRRKTLGPAERKALEVASENIGAFANAFCAMDVFEPGLGELLTNFVDVKYAPENADGVSERNIRRIIEVTTKLAVHLASKRKAAREVA